MPITDLIINGTFSSGSSGWSGNDIEINPQSAYIPGSSSNRVSEIDGRTGQTTVLEQSFSVSRPESTTLTFETALRTAANPEAGTDGFLVEILDSGGNVVASQSFFPTANSLTAESMNVTFPTAGNYTLRFTEVGNDDSLGAIVDNISILVCFTDGTLITTDRGDMPVEELCEGDRVLTMDSGYQPIRWIKSRTVSAEAQERDPRLRPVHFRKGSLGHNQPCRDLSVSRQHRMLVQGWQAELLFGHSEVLTAALNLVNDNTVTTSATHKDVTYYHFMFDSHEIVKANGCWAESFMPTELSLSDLPQAAREEFELLFPELLSDASGYGPAARPVASGKTATLLTLS